jgi:hypothetical protein
MKDDYSYRATARLSRRRRDDAVDRLVADDLRRQLEIRAREIGREDLAGDRAEVLTPVGVVELPS